MENKKGYTFNDPCQPCEENVDCNECGHYKGRRIRYISDKRIEELAKRLWGKIFPKRIEILKQGFCVICGELVQDFRDMISHKEYQISGMCQKCQDSVFKKGDDKKK